MDYKIFENGKKILQGNGFYISYNPLAASTDNIGETALVKEFKNEQRKFYILNGDWSDSYKVIAPLGYKACKAFFTKNIKYRGFWSN